MPDGDASGWVLGGRYRVLERLGTGGMAEVFRAHDETLDRDVAVKVFRTVVEDPDDPGGEERRELELHALARLNHPHLVTLYDGSVTQHPGFLVLELVDGPTLAQRLREGPLPEAAAVTLGTQIADALAYVHANGMVHRDVKPANILLGNDGGTGPGEMRARLSDFGIVRLVGANRVTAVGRTMGTATYLAPEQARGLDVEAPADVYSLGLVLIEALTGVPSFDGPMEEVLAARLSRPPDIPTTLPQPWPGLLTAMTAADPAARPTAATVASTLRGTAPIAAFASLPTAAVPPAAAALGAGAVAGAVAGAATGPLTGATAFTGPTGAPPVLAPLPVGDERRAPARHRRSGLGWALGAVALAAILLGGLVALMSFTGGGSPGDTPAPTFSNRHVPGPAGGTLAAKTKSSSSNSGSPAPSHSAGPSHSDAPSSAPQTSSSASTSQPPSTPHSSQTTTTTTSSSRPPSSSTSAPRTSSSAATSSSSAAAPAPARTTTTASTTSSSIQPAGGE